MPETMQAALVRQLGKPLRIEEVPVPSPGPGEVLVRVIACGVSHADLLVQGDLPARPKLPVIPGHEIAGTVAALGPGVTQFAVGDRVGVSWLHDACRACDYCETGFEALCERRRITGVDVDGGFADYVLASAPFTVRLPESLGFAEAAPILGAGVAAWRGLRETGVLPGDWVAISGIGGLGHLAIQYARNMGLHVVALDLSAEKLDLARQLGADRAIYAKSPRAVEQVREITDGGAHGALVTAVTYSAYEQAVALVRRGATVSLLGLLAGDFPVPIVEVVSKRITLRGSISGNRDDLNRALAIAAEGRVAARLQRASLTEINEVLSRLRGGKVTGRVVLDFSLGTPDARAGAATLTARP